jgi:transposase
MDHPVLGIDIGKSKFHVHLLLPDGKARPKVLANNAQGHRDLLDWLEKLGAPVVLACMEATGSYGQALARCLHDAGHVVSLVNPTRIKGYAMSEMTRTKTDKVDAGLIARFCLALKPKPWHPPAEHIERLQALMRRLEALGQMLQQEKNRLDVSTCQSVKESLDAHIVFLQADLATTRQAIHEHINQHPELKRQRDLLVSIPGIAEQTAAAILSEIGSIDAFESARQLAAFCGLTPREHASGTSVRGRPRLSRVGNSRLRKALFLPAVSACHYNPVLQALWKRLLERGKSKMSVVGAAMRKLVHLVFGVLKRQMPFDAEYGKTIA